MRYCKQMKVCIYVQMHRVPCRKKHNFLRKRTAAALSWQRTLQLPAEAPHCSRAPAPPSGCSDDRSLENIDTVPP